jgi:LemA protein
MLNMKKATFVEVTEARSKVSQMNINADTLNNPELMQQFSNAQAGFQVLYQNLWLLLKNILN